MLERGVDRTPVVLLYSHPDEHDKGRNSTGAGEHHFGDAGSSPA
jgi:hypothetical protein